MGEKTKELDSSWFKNWYTRKFRSINELVIILDKRWKKNIVDVQRICDWSIVQKFVEEQDIFNIISAYAS